MLPEDLKSLQNDFSNDANKKVVEWMNDNHAKIEESLEKEKKIALKYKLSQLTKVSE